VRRTGLLCLCLLLLWGCGSSVAQETRQTPELKSVSSRSDAAGQGQAAAAPAVNAGPFLDAVFHEAAAEGNDRVRVDLSACHEGYVAVSATSDKRLKFQVRFGDVVYTYDIRSDGAPSVFPLQSGDGDYVFRVMENVEGKKYAQIFLLERTVKLDDPFQPFLRPSDYCRYTADSLCVREAAGLSVNAGEPLEIVAAVYAYINGAIRYDHQKAATVQSGYLPDPDETLTTRKGICFDYASLAAAMLRSQGIPCKVIFGYVAPNELYHAWNMFYTEETGWVTVGFKANGKDWTRLDLTFTANGQDDAFIGDGSNYTDLYFY